MSTKLKTITPVDSISGMLGNRKTSLSKKAFICNISKRGGWKTKGAYMYLSLRVNDRLSPASTTEIAARTKFAAVVRSTRTRMMDPTQNPVDQVGFAKQDKYPTFYGYVFSQEWAAYGA
jgi:hypothetical protein